MSGNEPKVPSPEVPVDRAAAPDEPVRPDETAAPAPGSASAASAEDAPPSRNRFSLDRRAFLKSLGGGLVVFFTVDPFAWEAPQGRPGGGQRGPEYPEDWNAYLLVGEDGRVTAYAGKAELGQGPRTALSMIVAEELDLPLEAVDTICGDTDLCPYDMGTFGSRTIKYYGPPLRQAAAEARAVLVAMAAERLNAPAPALTAAGGKVFVTADPSRAFTYGELAHGRKVERHITPRPQPKPVAAHTVAGRPAKKKDAVEKVTGRGLFAGDIRRPGMLYGAVLRPPAHGAKLVSADTSAAESYPGARVVREGDFVAVLNETPDGAWAARDKIAAQWTPAPDRPDTDTIHEALLAAAPAGNVVEEKGDLAAGRAAAAAVVNGRYLGPYVAHAPMEPHTACAEVKDGAATVWAGTQRPFGVKDEVARTLNLPPEKVHVLTPYVGGGFGGKNSSGQAIEAARLSAASGRPVMVVWTRAEEFFNDTFMPAAVVDIAAGIDASGRLTLWDYTVDFAGERSSQPFYAIPHYRILAKGNWGGRGGGPSAHPFAVGAWRAPGSNTNTFARESHMDVLAAKAGLDPVEFRLRNLTDERMVSALKTAAARFGWTPGTAPTGRGQGVSLVDYMGTYVVTMAQVEVDKATGAVKVLKLVAVQDMGEVVHPDGALAQLTGSMTMGLGYALSEELRFKGGAILDRNFDTYTIPHFSWLPEIDATLVDNPGMAPQGGGEPGIVNMGAAIANAVFDAVEARVTRLPLTPARVRAALKSL